MAVVVALILVMIGGLAVMGSAMVSRVRAAAAADAVALAHASDPSAGQAVADWYRLRGLAIDVSAAGDGVSSAVVVGEPGQAQSWAQNQVAAVSEAPALVAVVARAGQLIGAPLTPVSIDATTIELSVADDAAVALVARDLNLCRVPFAATSKLWQICGVS